MILQSDPGSHQSTINLAASHHTTCRTESAFLTTAHSEKVGGGGEGKERVANWRKNWPLKYVFVVHQYSSLFTLFGISVLHRYLSSLLPPSVFGLALFRPHLNPLTI